MTDQTQQTMALSPAEGTQVLAPVTCPVCQTSNAPGEAWCVECGFQLGEEPGEAPQAEGPVEAGALVWLATGQRLLLHEGRNDVGRDPQGLLLSEPSVSRRHAAIHLENGGAWVEDLGSTNGTQVDQARVPAGARYPLQDGSELRLGAVTLSVELLEAYRMAPEAAAEQAASPASDLLLRGEDGAEYPLYEGVTRVGRRPDNEVQLADPYTSGHHAQVTRQGPGVVIVDLGSTNGTFLRGERLEAHSPAPLSPGESVTVGRTVLQLLRRGAGAPDEEGGDAAGTAEGDQEPSGPADEAG